MKRSRVIKSEYFQSSNETISIGMRSISTYQPFHWHDFYELEYIVKGSGTFILNGITIEMRPGMVFFSPPATFHEISFEEPAEIINMSFYSALISPELINSLITPVVTFDSTGHYRNMLDETLSRRQFTFKYDLEYITHILNAILINLLECSDHVMDKSPFMDKNLYKAILYINNHFLENITLSQIAKSVYLSTDYLSRLFYKGVGEHISTYILNMKMRYAHTLVIATQLPINEIAFRSGFGAVAHFTRTFKKKYGMSPSKLRQHSGIKKDN